MFSFYDEKVRRYIEIDNERNKIIEKNKELLIKNIEIHYRPLEGRVGDYEMIWYKMKEMIKEKIKKKEINCKYKEQVSVHIDEECAVCYENIQHIDRITYNCNHYFCKKCTLYLYNNHPQFSCPLCRTVIHSIFTNDPSFIL